MNNVRKCHHCNKCFFDIDNDVCPHCHNHITNIDDFINIQCPFKDIFGDIFKDRNDK